MSHPQLTDQHTSPAMSQLSQLRDRHTVRGRGGAQRPGWQARRGRERGEHQRDDDGHAHAEQREPGDRDGRDAPGATSTVPRVARTAADRTVRTAPNLAMIRSPPNMALTMARDA